MWCHFEAFTLATVVLLYSIPSVTPKNIQTY